MSLLDCITSSSLNPLVSKWHKRLCHPKNIVKLIGHILSHVSACKKPEGVVRLLVCGYKCHMRICQTSKLSHTNNARNAFLSIC